MAARSAGQLPSPACAFIDHPDPSAVEWMEKLQWELIQALNFECSEDIQSLPPSSVELLKCAVQLLSLFYLLAFQGQD